MPRYFDVEVTLVLSRRVWRRFLIQKSASFADLHLAIQDAFGWQNYHLFEFRHPGHSKQVIAGRPDEDAPHTPDARRVRVCDRVANPLLYGATWYEYEYDFGDGWDHQVLLEKVVELDDPVLALCLGGARACPPEDCGGFWGYDNMLAILKDPKHPEYKSMNEWLGSKFDPEAFDVEVINKRLARLAPRPRKTSARKAAGRSAK